MKKFLLLSALTVLLFSTAFAQVPSTPTHSFKHHEIRFGLGDPLLLYHQLPETFNSSLTIGQLFQKAPYGGRICTTLPITIGYRYRALKWLWIGGDLSYCGMFGRPDNPILTESFNAHLFQLALSVRFSYLNREKVTLYSEFTHSIVSVNKGFVHNERVHAQYTLIGVEFGSQQWFGSAELGYGFKGIINVGVGYHL